MLQRRTAIAAVLAGAVAVAGAVFAQSPSQPIVGISTITTYSADVRITAVDPNARTVTFTFANGATATRKLSPSLANFNAARVGDAVSVAFEDRLTFVLSGPNARVPGGRDVSVAAAAQVGQRVGAVAGDESINTWWVTSVDPAAGKVSLVSPNGGMVRTYSVTTPEGREQLPRVKPGDNVTAINREVLVVSITPKA